MKARFRPLHVLRGAFVTVALPAMVLCVDASSAATPAVTEFSSGITAGAAPRGITPGPDGNLWFTEARGRRIGRITPAGTVSEFSAGITPGSTPTEITTGPDGNLWFTEYSGNRIGRITPSGTVTEFSAGITAGAYPTGIAPGRDGNLWFTESSGDRIGRITPSGTVTEFSTGITSGAFPTGITPGPDGNLWFAESDGDRIGRITPSGAVTEFGTGISPGSTPSDISAGPDGNLWFTERDRIGRITPSGTVTELSAGITTPAFLLGITTGSDGNLWFAEFDGDKIGRVDTAQDPPAFSNPFPIAIPDGAPVTTSGRANPYPSEINVSSLQGKTTGVRVHLNGLGHTHPDDVEVLLQAPSGQTALLMGDAGGGLVNQAATLAFDDASSLRLPDSGPIVSGIFGPSSNDSTSFPAPAPQPPYGTTLSALDGIDPNGSWKLFVNDDANGDTGALRGGWGLDIDTTGPPPPEPLMLTLRAKPKQKVGRLKVKATCSSACDLSASAKGKADGEKFKSKPTEGDGTENLAEKLKLALSKGVLKRVDGEKGRATIGVTATSPGGGADSATAKVKLK